MNEVVKRLRAKSRLIDPTVFIGRDVSEGLVDEIKKQLKGRGLIKIKVNKSCYEGKDKKDFAEALAAGANAVLIDQVGYMIVLARRGYSPLNRDKNR